MARDMLATPRPSTTVTTRIQDFTDPDASHRDTHMDILSRRPHAQRRSHNDSSEVQVLNFHPVLERRQSAGAISDNNTPGRRVRVGGTPVSRKTIDEHYWMLPGAIFTEPG